MEKNAQFKDRRVCFVLFLKCENEKNINLRETRLTNCVVPVVQHYPLYRVSDAGCTGLDAAPPEERHLLFREKYDVLSKEASQKVSTLQSHLSLPSNNNNKTKAAAAADDDCDDVSEWQPVSEALGSWVFSPQLLQWFKPRLILSGHTHSGCEVLHDNKYPEISVPSFSWRNRNNPSFILVSNSSTQRLQSGPSSSRWAWATKQETHPRVIIITASEMERCIPALSHACFYRTEQFFSSLHWLSVQQPAWHTWRCI